MAEGLLMERDRIVVRVKQTDSRGIDLLPDVLRQLRAMVRLLSEVASDPRLSKVEVLSLSKQSPLSAELRVVRFREEPKPGSRPGRPTPERRPIRDIERALDAASATNRRSSVSPEILTAVADFAKELRDDTAEIQTFDGTRTVSKAIIGQIQQLLGPTIRTAGTVTGILEGINVHTMPWSFALYPEIGPSKIRCLFDPVMLKDVQRGIKQVVTVTGEKEFVAHGKWPLRVFARSIHVRAEPPAESWLTLAEDLARIWDSADDDDRAAIMEGWSA